MPWLLTSSTGCALLAGGSSILVVVAVEVVAVAVAAVVSVGRGVDELSGGAGDGDHEGDEHSSGVDGLGHVTSLKFSGQNSRIFSYSYHCRLLERPAGGRTGGSSSAFGDHDWTFRIDIFTLVDPAFSFTKMQPGCAESNRRWWSFLIPGTFVQVLKYSCQLYVVTKALPSSRPVGWATLTVADSFTIPTKSVRPLTFVLLYFFLRSLKHQSGMNLVWPGIMNESVIS